MEEFPSDFFQNRYITKKLLAAPVPDRLLYLFPVRGLLSLLCLPVLSSMQNFQLAPILSMHFRFNFPFNSKQEVIPTLWVLRQSSHRLFPPSLAVIHISIPMFILLCWENCAVHDYPKPYGLIATSVSS